MEINSTGHHEVGTSVNDQPPRGIGRRTLFAGGFGALGALALSGCVPGAGGAGASSASPSSPPATSEPAETRTRVVLLGTGGGPAILDGDQHGVSTAVVYGDRVYIVDLGHASHTQVIAAGLAPDIVGAPTLARVRGILFTHMHSDHTAEWPALYATGGQNIAGREWNEPVSVFGPGVRDSLVRVFPPGRPEPELFAPDNPTPGIAGTTSALRTAFATDFNDRIRDNNFGNPDDIFDVRDIDLSGIWQVDPAGVPPRLDTPIDVWTDGDVRITATLVDHRPTAPAFAYRFDTPDGSVVVSGDTRISENLIALAEGCDVLVHEVIDPSFVDRLAETVPEEARAGLVEHLLAAHTTIEEVGRDVAEPAGAKSLVLSHFVPADGPPETWEGAQEGFSGELIIGRDLMQIPVGTTKR